MKSSRNITRIPIFAKPVEAGFPITGAGGFVAASNSAILMAAANRSIRLRGADTPLPALGVAAIRAIGKLPRGDSR